MAVVRSLRMWGGSPGCSFGYGRGGGIVPPYLGWGEDVEVVVACLPENPLGTTESESEGF